MARIEKMFSSVTAVKIRLGLYLFIKTLPQTVLMFSLISQAFLGENLDQSSLAISKRVLTFW